MSPFYHFDHIPDSRHWVSPGSLSTRKSFCGAECSSSWIQPGLQVTSERVLAHRSWDRMLSRENKQALGLLWVLVRDMQPPIFESHVSSETPYSRSMIGPRHIYLAAIHMRHAEYLMRNKANQTAVFVAHRGIGDTSSMASSNVTLTVRSP